MYASPDATITLTDQQIGSSSISDYLSNTLNSSGSVTRTLMAPSSALTPGNYYIGAYVDPVNFHSEQNEGNNTVVNGSVTVIGKLTVTYPNGGENWSKGKCVNLTWVPSANLTGNIQIQWYKNDQPGDAITTTTPVSTGSYDYTIPYTLAAGNDYDVRMSAMGGHVWDKSDGLVTLSDPLPATGLIGPDDGANTNRAPAFEWVFINNQTDFQLLIDPNQDWCNPQENITLPTASNCFPLDRLLSPGTYHWKLAYATASGISDWSETRSFTVLPYLPAPTLLAPANNATTSPTPTFEWAAVSGQTDFQLLIDPAENWCAPLKNIPRSLSGNSYTLSEALPPGDYTWKLVVATASGISDWSEVRTFTVLDAAVPVLLAPAQNETVTSEAINLQWSDVGAVRYEVMVDNNSGLGSREVLEEDLTVTSYTIPGYFLEGEQTYFWKVIAHFADNSETESTQQFFHYYPPKLAYPHWVPLYRLYKNADNDHFYCTTEEQRQVAAAQGYVEERIEGHVAAKPFIHPDMVNIYRLYSNEQKAHYYTSDGNDKDLKIIAGYNYEGIIGFAYGTDTPERVALHRLYKEFSGPPVTYDYFCTISYAERVNAVNNYGFTDDEIVAYLSPNSGNISEPLMLAQMLAGMGVNTQNGNFTFPTVTSFNIPGKGMPLNFTHIYNSLAGVLFADLKPLGPGWSHAYNAYISVFDPDDPATLINVHWPDGSNHLYLKNGSVYSCLTEGVYDEFEAVSFPDHFRVTKKSQLVYDFTAPLIGSPAVLSSITDRNNNVITFSYNAISNKIINLSEVTGTAGRKLILTYYTNPGEEHLIHTVRDPLNRTVQFEYDSKGRLSRFIDAETKSTYYEYDSAWEQDYLLTRITLPRGNVIENDYDTTSIGNSLLKVVVEQSYNNGVERYGFSFNKYPSTGGIKTTVTDLQNHNWDYISDDKHYLRQVMSQLGNVASMERNDPANPTLPTTISDGLNQSTTMSYDSRGNLLQVNRPMGVVHRFQYNAFNDVTRYTNPRNNITDYGYDGNGNLLSVSDPRGNTIFTRTSFGKIESVRNPMNHTSYLTYNGWGNLETVNDPLNHTTTFSYDNASRLTSATNPRNQATQFQYDQRDLVTAMIDAALKTTGYIYDDNGNLTDINNARGYTTHMGYNNRDWLSSIQNPSSTATQFEYFKDGRLKRRTNPDGEAADYSYDNLNRLWTVTSPDLNATFSYDMNHNLTAVSEPTVGDGGMSFNYDALNRLTHYSDYFGNTVDYSYDANSNLTSMTYNGTRTVNYTYANDDRLSTVTDWNGKTTSYTYRNDGSLDQIIYPNGVHCQYSYDDAERITGKSITRGNATVIAEYTFVLDEIGNHLEESVQQPLAVPALPPASISYNYDPANRIQNAGSISYGFDPNGNMISRSEGGNTVNYTYDSEHRLTALSGAESAAYLYDVFGNRHRAVRNGVETRYLLDLNGPMSRVLMELDGSNNPLHYYIYGLGLVARIGADGSTTHYYHSDFRGSIVAMSDAGENITHSYAYEPYGAVLDLQEADPNPFRFVGGLGVMDEGNGLTFMRARYYNPEIGRFLSEDPVWDVNLYAYAGDNPVSYYDPTGNNTEWSEQAMCINDRESAREYYQTEWRKNQIKIMGLYGQISDLHEQEQISYDIMEISIDWFRDVGTLAPGIGLLIPASDVGLGIYLDDDERAASGMFSFIIGGYGTLFSNFAGLSGTEKAITQGVTFIADEAQQWGWSQFFNKKNKQ
ncbi:MAG: hypothetical protein KDI38_11725 [Calditrichaeota bacterium]|nr:hypothetical protein [Calditrichota bacterium]